MKSIPNSKIIFLMLIVAIHTLFALDKEKVYEELQNRYLSAKSLKISFIVSNSVLRGNFVFQAPNRFRLELLKGSNFENIVVSNGETLWNYNVPNKDLIISKVIDTDDYSLQTLFTNFSKKYKPFSLSKEIHSNIGSNLVLTLKQTENPEQYARIYLDSKLKIKGIEIEQENRVALYIVKSININFKLPRNYFEFKVPKDANIFDYR